MGELYKMEFTHKQLELKERSIKLLDILHNLELNEKGEIFKDKLLSFLECLDESIQDEDDNENTELNQMIETIMEDILDGLEDVVLNNNLEKLNDIIKNES
jgi:hypothetical protein